MTSESAAQQRPTRNNLTIGMAFFGYAAVVLGVVSGINWFFDLELAYKGWKLPGQWRISLLGILGGGTISLLAHFLESTVGQRVIKKQKWLVWLGGIVLVFVALAAIFLAVK